MREGWELKSLKDICLKTNNLSWKDNTNKTFQYIDLSAVSRDTLTITESTEIDENNAPSRAKKIIKTNDVIFATTRPTLNRMAIVPSLYNNQICSTGFVVLRANIDMVLAEYIFYSLQEKSFMDKMEELQRGASYPAVSDNDVKNFEIPIPPLPEQKQIVKTLDLAFGQIDQAKANLEQNLSNAKELFASKLNEVFSQRGEGWEEKTLKEVCSQIFAGGDVPKENFSKDKTEKYSIPIYANAVKKHGLYGYTNIARVKEAAISIAARGSGTGHTEIRLNPFFPIVRLIVLIPNKDLINLQFLKYIIDNLDILRSGSAIPQLTVPMIKTYKILIPNISTQEKLVENLNSLSREIETLQTHYQQNLNNLEELKKSILEKAFKGEL